MRKRILFTLCGVVMACGTSAKAGLVSDTMLDVADLSDPTVPVFFEDNNFSLALPESPGQLAPGDPVVGAINIQAISRGDRSADGSTWSITDANPDAPTTALGDGVLIGLLNAEVDTVAPGSLKTVVRLTDRNGAATSFADPGGGGTITVPGMGADTMLNIYEDDSPEAFVRSDISDLFANITDGTLIGTLGGDDTNGAVFYEVVIDNGTGQVESFTASLDFLTSPGLPPINTNDLGTELYGAGQVTGDGIEGGVLGDGDFSVLIPEPGTLALVALGGLAVLRRRNR